MAHINFINRAFLHTIRKAGKSLVLCLVILIISILLLTSITIHSATKTAQLNVRQSLGGKYIINAKGTEGQLTNTILDKIALINGVEGITNAHSESYAEYKASDGTLLDTKTDPSIIEKPKGFEHAGKLQSNMYSKNDDFFTTKDFSLIKGRHIIKNDEHAVMIHNDFAKRNQLTIGDKILLDLNSEMVEEPNYISHPVEVEIVGIFDHSVEQETARNVSYTLYENTVFTDPISFTKLFDWEKVPYYSNAQIRVNDPAKLDTIVNKMKTIKEIDWSKCVITPQDKDYQNAKRPLDALNNLVGISIVIISVIAILLLVMILAMWMRSRLQETGMLIAIGISKLNIFLQHLTELLLIATIAFTLSFPIGNIISQQVGDALLEQTQSTDVSNNHDTNELETKTSPHITELEVTITISHILFIYMNGILFAIISVLISTIPVIRMKPKQILSTLS